MQASIKNPHLVHLSVSLPTPPPETTFSTGLPLGAIDAIKSAYSTVVHILDPPRDGFNLTVKLNLSKLPPNQGYITSLLLYIYCFVFNTCPNYYYYYHFRCLLKINVC